MKKLALVITMFVVAHVAVGQKYKGDSWAKVKASGSGTLTVFYYEQPGLIYEEGGKMKGALRTSWHRVTLVLVGNMFPTCNSDGIRERQEVGLYTQVYDHETDLLDPWNVCLNRRNVRYNAEVLMYYRGPITDLTAFPSSSFVFSLPVFQFSYDSGI